MKSEDFIPLVQSEGHGATATTAKHAAQQADIVMLLVPGGSDRQGVWNNWLEYH